MTTNISRSWTCDVCGRTETMTNEFDRLEKVTENHLNKMFPNGWFNQYISIPGHKGEYTLICPECAAKLKGETFADRIASYAKLFHGKVFDRPILTVDAIVVKGNQFLLVKRKNPPHGWALPGGLVDLGETVETAVVRELREETCLDAVDIKFMTIMSNPTRDPRFQAVSAVFIINAFTGEAKAADDAKEVGWYSYDTILEKEDIAFDHKDILKLYMQKNGQD